MLALKFVDGLKAKALAPLVRHKIEGQAPIGVTTIVSLQQFSDLTSVTCTSCLELIFTLTPINRCRRRFFNRVCPQ
jgi:hypothetical protein